VIHYEQALHQVYRPLPLPYNAPEHNAPEQHASRIKCPLGRMPPAEICVASGEMGWNFVIAWGILSEGHYVQGNIMSVPPATDRLQVGRAIRGLHHALGGAAW